MPVPDGIDGMRLDAGVSRILGLSRTVVATLADSGDVTVDGAAHEVRATSCDPTPFEADLGALVGAWLTNPPR